MLTRVQWTRMAALLLYKLGSHDLHLLNMTIVELSKAYDEFI
jgi:hypothetical protein